MILTRAKLAWQKWRRRLCACVTLLAYVVAAIGFPLPESAAQGTHACGQQVCGCGTVEQCQAGGCCCSHGEPHDEAPPEEPETSDCCSKKKPSRQDAKPSTKQRGQSVRWVVGISALKCHGGATHWITAQAALPTEAPLTWQPSWPYCHSLTMIQEYPLVISEEHVDPPPRA